MERVLPWREKETDKLEEKEKEKKIERERERKRKKQKRNDKRVKGKDTQCANDTC